MGIRSKLRKAGDIVAAPAVGAYKGLVATGAAPAANTIKGAARGDKSDLAAVGIVAAGVIPAGRFARGAQVASRARGLGLAERAAVAARVAVTKNPVFHGTTKGAAGAIYSEGFKTAGGISYAAKDIRAAANYARTASRLEGGKPAVVVGKLRPGAQGRTIGLGGVGMNDADIIPTPSIKTAMGVLGGSILRGARRNLGTAKSRLSSERGSLKYDEYMDKVRSRFKAPAPYTDEQIANIADMAEKGVPKGQNAVIGVAYHGPGWRGASGSAGGSLRVMRAKPIAARLGDSPSRRAYLGANDPLERSGSANVRRAMKGHGFLRGFYEKVNDESGMIKFPDKESNAIRRIKNSVMDAIKGQSEGGSFAEASQRARGVLKEVGGADSLRRESYNSVEGFLESKGALKGAQTKVDRMGQRLNDISRMRSRSAASRPKVSKGERGWLRTNLRDEPDDTFIKAGLKPRAYRG